MTFGNRAADAASMGPLIMPVVSDWSAWNLCPVCQSATGVPCWTMSSGGPDALPPAPRERPHAGRKPRRR